MPETFLRPATPEDVPQILALIRALAEYEKLAHKVTATEDRLRQTLFGPRPAAEAVLAYHDDVCVGFALFFPIYSTFLAQPGLHLEDLYVKPEFRGRGIGLRLLAYLARTAAARGCYAIKWQVLDWNRPAIAFYENLGARPDSDWITYRLEGPALQRLASS
jgi:GNAT superfamily N-acetyltransferase